MLGRTKDEHLRNARHLQVVKGGIASLLVIFLMYAGQQGKQHAKLQGRLQDLTLVSDQLQHKLEDEQSSVSTTSNPQLVGLASNLKVLLSQFEADYPLHKFSQAESLEIRLS